MITLQDKRYPKLLKEIGKEAPKQLYYKGEWSEDTDIFDNCLAVVGSRRMTNYGRRVTEQIITEVASAGITIVSGFMYGIDATAHKAAVRAGGRTVAVMPCGIDLIHPEYQKDLYNQILDTRENEVSDGSKKRFISSPTRASASGKEEDLSSSPNRGLIISEYEGNTQPALWTYPQRNRIVAGLSRAVLVIEAGEKSGSLITANWAKKFKRKIFAVPGPITSVVSKGTLQLIKEGAEIATCAKDILVYFKLLRKQNFEIEHTSEQSECSVADENKVFIEPPNTQANETSEASQGKARLFSSKDSEVFQKIQGSNLEQKIIEYLQGEPLGIDELSQFLGVSASELGVALSMLQLRGLISQEGTRYYIDK